MLLIPKYEVRTPLLESHILMTYPDDIAATHEQLLRKEWSFWLLAHSGTLHCLVVV
jgi:hypothetical protein